MGALMSCMSSPSPSDSPPQAKRRSSASSRRGGGAKAAEIDEQALATAAALVLGQRGTGGAFDRSASVRYAAKRQQQGPPLPRSSSTRPRSLADPELQPQQLLAKVILVGHDFGGACISHAMEMFPSKVAKAVFLCATMLTNGHSALDIFQQQMDTNGMLQKAQELVYSNGKDRPPTAINIDRASVRDLLFNQSPAKDVSLASVSMRPIPFAPVMEKLTLTEGNYGSVRRFFVETTEDNAIPLSLQQSMCVTNPPEKVLRLKGSDHAPFFSRPQALHKTLVEIATLPRAQAS